MGPALALSLILIISGCSGWNSELDTALIEKSDEDLKPRCHFKLKENCWTRSMKMVMDCVPQAQKSSEVMSPDKRFCTDGEGKYIDFVNPLSLEGDFSEEGIEFYVNDGPEKTCFHFEGTADNFTINDYIHGQLKVETAKNGDVHVSCFFGESLLIPAKVQEQGCRNQKVKPGLYTPKSTFVKTQTPQFLEIREGSSYLFSFVGLGKSSQPVFNCQL